MYLAPDAPVSASWQAHKDRTPPSSEPGTDYATPYGAAASAPWGGVVIETKTDNGGAMGRFAAIALDDGRTWRALHLASVAVRVGDRIERGDQVGVTGASGYGSDWYYGPHIHETLWPGAYWANPTIDFELYVGANPPEPTTDDNLGGNMFVITSADNPTQWILVTVDGGQMRGKFLEDPIERAVIEAIRPPIPKSPCDGPTFNAFLQRIGYVYGRPIPLLDVHAVGDTR